MDSKGRAALETAVVFPLFVIMIVSLLLLLGSIAAGMGDNPDETDFMTAVHKADSMLRKAEMIHGAIE